MRFQNGRSIAPRRILPALLLLGPGTGCLPFVSGDPAPTLVDGVRAVGEAPARVDSLWPGFVLRDRGFLLYEPGGGALLVTDEAAPPGFTAESDVPASFRGRAYRSRGTPPGLEGGIDTRYRLGEILTTAYPLGSTLGASLVGLYHESFHAYQDERFAGDTVAEEHVPAELLTAEFAAMVEVERRMLSRALALSAEPEMDSEMDSLLLSFLAVRRERLADLPPRVSAAERALERREGSANLVGYQLAVATLGAAPDQLTKAVDRYLTVDLGVFGGDPANQLLRWRAYGTGAAMGLLLDRRAEHWRRRLEAGVPFDSLLAESLGPDTRGSALVVAAALDEFGYERSLREAAAAPSSADEQRDFYRMAPVRLVIAVEPRDTAGYSARMSYNISRGLWDRLLRRRGGVSRPEAGLTLIWQVDLLHTSNPEEAGFALRVEGRPVAMDFRAARSLVAYTVLLPAMPRVQGDEPGAGVRHYPDGLVIEGAGMRFQTEHPVTLHVARPDSVVVRLSP